MDRFIEGRRERSLFTICADVRTFYPPKIMGVPLLTPLLSTFDIKTVACGVGKLRVNLTAVKGVVCNISALNYHKWLDLCYIFCRVLYLLSDKLLYCIILYLSNNVQTQRNKRYLNPVFLYNFYTLMFANDFLMFFLLFIFFLLFTSTNHPTNQPHFITQPS